MLQYVITWVTRSSKKFTFVFLLTINIFCYMNRTKYSEIGSNYSSSSIDLWPGPVNLELERARCVEESERERRRG